MKTLKKQPINIKAPSTGCRSKCVTGLMNLFSPASGSRRFRGLFNEGGQVTILMALLATVLLASTALVIDSGASYSKKRNLQNTADAAALAGVMEIAEDRGAGAAEAVAKDYVQTNTAGVESVEVAFPGANKVRVRLAAGQQTFFARIFGINSVTVHGNATAETVLAGQVNHLMPLIVPFQRVGPHIGLENAAMFELGEDRPLKALSIMYEVTGQQVKYIVSYTNQSNKSVSLRLWSPVPAGASYVAGSATSGGAFDGANVVWNWAGVAAGDSRMASFVVDFAGSVNPAGQVFASVNGGQTQNASTDGAQKGFFWLTDFNSGSAGTPDFGEWIINGYPKPVSLGDSANGTGVRSSLKAAMDTRIARDPSVVLPLYDYTEGGGHGANYHVVGFAEFVITDFSFTGNPKHVTGYFTNGTVTPGFGGGEPVDQGVKVVRLSE